MIRTLLLSTFFLVAVGCQLPPERVPRPLPEDSPPLPFAELLTRARAQAIVATESFFKDQWAELEDSARGLEQTARFLRKAEDVPSSHKEILPAASSELAKEASKLREAALMKNVKETNAILTRINARVRELPPAP